MFAKSLDHLAAVYDRLDRRRLAFVLWWRIAVTILCETVFCSVKVTVADGLAHRDFSGVEGIGVDELAYAKGQRYVTMGYQLNSPSGRLLVDDRRLNRQELTTFVSDVEESKDRCT